MMPTPKATAPDRALVLRIAQEEAMASRVTLTDILDMRPYPDAKAARIRCWKRIREATGCGCTALARAWGCHPQVIWAAFRSKQAVGFASMPVSKLATAYDAATIARLVWQYGPERAEEIVAGRHTPTNIDIASWRALGRAA